MGEILFLRNVLIFSERSKQVPFGGSLFANGCVSAVSLLSLNPLL